jgi:hypothetical protein
MAKRNHYVDNRKFLEAFKNYLPVVRPLRAAYRERCQELLAQGVTKKELPKFQRPQTPDYDFIGECLLKIAEHLAYKINFINYTYRDEMVGDAIENAVLYMENFDPEKSSNPFAYFTQVMTYAFYRRITEEEEHSYIKQKSLEGAMDFFSTQGGDSGAYANTYIDFIRDVKSDIIKNFEDKKAKKKRAAPVKKTRKKIEDPGIDKFMVHVEETAPSSI